MSWIAALSAALLFIGTIVSDVALAKEGLNTLAPGVLRIGAYFVNPPFEYLSKGKKVVFEVDLMSEIGNYALY